MICEYNLREDKVSTVCRIWLVVSCTSTVHAKRVNTSETIRSYHFSFYEKNYELHYLREEKLPNLTSKALCNSLVIKFFYILLRCFLLYFTSLAFFIKISKLIYQCFQFFWSFDLGILSFSKLFKTHFLIELFLTSASNGANFESERGDGAGGGYRKRMIEGRGPIHSPWLGG